MSCRELSVCLHGSRRGPSPHGARGEFQKKKAYALPRRGGPRLPHADPHGRDPYWDQSSNPAGSSYAVSSGVTIRPWACPELDRSVSSHDRPRAVSACRRTIGPIGEWGACACSAPIFRRAHLRGPATHAVRHLSPITQGHGGKGTPRQARSLPVRKGLCSVLRMARDDAPL